MHKILLIINFLTNRILLWFELKGNFTMNFLLYMDAYWIFLMIVIIIRVIASSHFLSPKDMKKWREMVFQGYPSLLLVNSKN